MIRGLEVASVWFDEMAEGLDPVAQTMAQTSRVLDTALNRKVVDPLDIVCRRCGSAVGRRCTDRYKCKDHERKPHYRRKADALLVQQAARAMLPRGR